MTQKIQHACQCCGLVNGSTIQINTVWDINCVMRVWAFCLMIQRGSFFARVESKSLCLILKCLKIDSNYVLLLITQRNLQYIERDGNEFLYTLQAYPDWLQKKITLLKYFRDYMSQHLLKVKRMTFLNFSIFSINISTFDYFF